jgi:hypothetical protein
MGFDRDDGRADTDLGAAMDDSEGHGVLRAVLGDRFLRQWAGG